MTHPASYRPKHGEIPTNPGVYRFRDQHARIIYVGKAKNLRSRLNSYFASPDTLSPKTHAMVHSASSVEWTIVGSELEALQLEYSWIKEFTPRFNIAFRDDKSYPYLAVTMSEKYPRIQVMRGDKRKGTRYFGPYSHAWAIRETVDTLLRVFPVRSCSPGVFKRAHSSGRPCLLGYIDKCSAPCVGRISQQDHYALAQQFCDFMSGRAKPFIAELEQKMADAVATLNYEQAARLRDDIAALRKAFERNTMVLDEDIDADIFAVSEDELEAAVQVFYIRGGRIRGERGWVMEKVEDLTTAEVIEHLIQQIYGEDYGEDNERIPVRVYLPHLPSNKEQLEEWLSGLRGSKVSIHIPQRGDKAALMATVKENANHALILHKSRRASDLTTRSKALQELQEALEIPMALLRIECFDISHTSGTNVVASMVVVEDGLPKKSDYRKFSVSGAAAVGDTAAMYDVVTRRFRHYLQEKKSAKTDESRSKFAYPPNLVVVDGGKPQVSAASKALEDLDIDDIYVIGLAKRLEEVWVPHSDFPIILPRSSQGLYMLQRIRDEAHRFAITFHRKKRSTSMTVSALDRVPGLGPAKRKALLQHFGSLKKVRAASKEELMQVPGVGPALAEVISSTLNHPTETPLGENQENSLASSVNMTTGEILS